MGEQRDNKEIPSLGRLADLVGHPPAPVTTRVLIEEDHWIYICVGQARADIAATLGWNDENIWMPEHVLRYVSERHPVILNPVRAFSVLLQQALTVHEDRKDKNHRYFIVDGETLRADGLLSSQTVRYVDAVVEWRHVPDGRIMRAFHLSPNKRNQGGQQLWP
ncbi:hypothetical protein BH23CHL1_BH23CHL1_21980 [soil metagenome]